MKKITLLFFVFVTLAQAQDLTLLSEGDLVMSNGSTLFVNGMEFQPSSNYTLAGPNEFTTVPVPLTEPKSISRVVELTKPLESYVGGVVFYYQDDELNSLSEENLELVIKNLDSRWQNLESNLDLLSKMLNVNFEEPISFAGFTASEKRALSNGSFENMDLQVYPNPVQSILKVNYTYDLEMEIFNVLGSSLIQKTGKQVNLSSLSSGTYVVKLTNPETGDSLYRKIVKQ